MEVRVLFWAFSPDGPDGPSVFVSGAPAMAKSKGQSKATNHEPAIENRRARYDYAISDTVDCGIKLTGTEIKSVRLARVNLAEGFARAAEGSRIGIHSK